MAKRTRAEWADKLVAASRVLKPIGLGPYPLIINLHGCGGLRPFMDHYTKAALQRGVAVMNVDSFRPRGLTRLSGSALVCTGVLLHGTERSEDVFALYDWAQRQPWIDKRRIAFAGWSHGGWTIMDALALGERAARYCRLSDLPARPLEGLAGAIAIYPYMGPGAVTRSLGWTHTKAPLYCLMAGKDQVVGTHFPPRALDRLEKDGVEVHRLVLPEATHAFDDEGASDPRTRYRPDLLDQTVAWYGDALTAMLRK